MEDDIYQVHNEVILHLPSAPDTTGYFLESAATGASSSSFGDGVASAASPNGDAAVAGAAVSSGVNSSAPSVSSAGPFLPGEVSSPLPPVSSGSGRALSAAADADAKSCCTSSASEDVSFTSTADVCCSMAPDPRRVLYADISSDAGCDADLGAIVATNGVSASEDACFSDLPGHVFSSASGLPGASNAAASSSSFAEKSCGMACAKSKPRILSDRVVRFVFRHLPIKSIFRMGYLLSKNWLQIWRGMPLVMHDLQLAPDCARESLSNGDIHSINLTKKISQVIYLHPGPIQLFRIDSSTWRSGNSLQWRVWIHKLISKNVEEIIICGRWPRLPMEALPNNLIHCKSLKKLHVCFFSWPQTAENIVLPYLTELHMYYCVFNGSDLDNILRSCELMVLTLGYVKLSILQIKSQTLQVFMMWRCKIDILCLNGTPSLTVFIQEPQWTWDHMSHLQLRGISNLQVLSEIYLDQQTIELYGYLIKADMLEYPLCLSVTRLAVAVNFSSRKGLAMVPSLLKCFPELQTLRISRTGSTEDYTGPAIDWHSMFSTIPCIKKNLKIFELCYAHGDEVENDLAEAICRCAAALKEFQIDPHPHHRSRTG